MKSEKANILLHVVDLFHESFEYHISAVDDTLLVIVIFNKIYRYTFV